VIRDTDTHDSRTEPKCHVIHRADRAEWRRETLTAGLAAFKDACGSCFPGGQPEIGTVIVRSTSHHANVYHRPAEETEPEAEADGGTEALADGGSGELHDHTAADRIERHLSEILDAENTASARYHARSALQHVHVLEESDRP